jgi:hypothetical protein
MPIIDDSNYLPRPREAADNHTTDTREIPMMRTEEIVAELRDVVLLCDTPQALLEIATALTITLDLVEGVADNLSVGGQVIDQITAAPYRGRHRSNR